MNHPSTRITLSCLLAALVASAVADPGDRGHGRGPKGSAYIEQRLDGLCLVEHRWDERGRFTQERRCREPSAHAPQHGVRYGIHYPVPASGAIARPAAIGIAPQAIVAAP